jgi:hypothetical protein
LDFVARRPHGADSAKAEHALDVVRPMVDEEDSVLSTSEAEKNEVRQDLRGELAEQTRDAGLY